MDATGVAMSEASGKRSDGRKLSGLLQILVCLVLASEVRAQEARPHAVVILDGSGSMWGPIDGTPKIEVAQQGLTSLIERLEGRADLGLLGYGHRRKGDCRDIDLAFPPGPIDAAAAKQWVAKFSPRGKTPMASAITTAGQALAEKGPGGSIVVVTDGADNCRQDPCAAASALIDADPTLKMHVVILGKTDEDMRKTRCIAEAGHGSIADVGSPAELAPALDKIVMALTGSATPEGADAAAAGPPGLRLSLRLGADGAEWTEGLAWEVTRDGVPVYTGSSARPALDLAPGRYRVKVTTSGLVAEQDADVAERGATTVTLNLQAGMMRINLVAGTGSASVAEAYYAIYRSDPATGAELETVAVGRGSPPPLLLAAGTYRAVFEQGLARIERALTVEAGRDAGADIAFDIGTLRLSARASAGGPVVDDVYFTVAEDDPEAAGGRREVTASAAAEPYFTLRAGIYHVRVERGTAVATEDVTVRGGETTAATIVIPSGRVTLQSRIAGSPEPIDRLVSYAIERLEPAATVARLNGPEATALLAEGRYRVTSQYGAGNARADKEFAVGAGSAETVTVEHEAGSVAFAIEGGPAKRLMQWTVKGADGSIVWTSADPAPQVPLSAGDYQVEVKVGARTLAERFNVAPGEAKTVRIRPE
jgi:Ca-activated chloride channel family protein